MYDTQSCLNELEALSSEDSSDKRREILRRVTDLFFLTIEQQTARDTAAFGNVLERIAYELEVEARAELSKRMSDTKTAPRRLMCRLARDEIGIARPVLERSGALTDEDLIQIARTSGQTHLHAISRRPHLAAPVTDVIVERGEADVLVEVTRNEGAEFSQNGMDALAEKARSDGALLNALGSRVDLPPDIKDEIKKRVAERIKSEYAEKYDDADMAKVDALVDESADNLNLDEFSKSNEEIERTAAENQLNEDMILKLAKARRLPETVRALSVLTGLDDRMISHTLLKAEPSALAVVCKANDFSAVTFLALLQTRLGESGLSARDIAKAMREYDSLSIANTTRTIRFLKARRSAEATKTATA